jgi:hypothetical protein
MQEFEQYVKSNWNVPQATSCGITYTHTVRTAKKVINHSINLTISWRDKDNNLIKTEKLAFLNDDMPKTYDKKMLTINRKELVNKYRLAKTAIVHKIIAEKQAKAMVLQDEITSLANYVGRVDDIISPTMKNTIQLVQTPSGPQQNSTPHTQFDM